MKTYNTFLLLLIFAIFYSCSSKEIKPIKIENTYPWCIVAFDSLDRSPDERIKMLKEFGFTKYAYDGNNEYLNDMGYELDLARENNIEIISVWFWLNAKRDSLHKLSPANELILKTLKEEKLSTTLWVSFNNNFFKGLTHEESVDKAVKMIDFIYKKAEDINCSVALYNHKDWFGDHKNQVEIIEAMPDNDLKIVYNFHHAHDFLDDLPETIRMIKPYLSNVNLNGMREGGPKILPIGKGDRESEMIKLFMDAGFDGPWGILGHVKSEDVEKVLEQNINGLDSLLSK